MKAGSGKLDVMTGPFENARFVTGACEEKGVMESKRMSARVNILKVFRCFLIGRVAGRQRFVELLASEWCPLYHKTSL